MYTDYHSQFWAHALTLKSASDSIHNLSRSIANAKVDLNPNSFKQNEAIVSCSYHFASAKSEEIRRDSQAATALTEKLAAQKRLKQAESERNKKRRELYDAQDEIDQQREVLIAKTEKQLGQRRDVASVFCIQWTIK